MPTRLWTIEAPRPDGARGPLAGKLTTSGLTLYRIYAGTPETIAPKLTSLLSLSGVACPDARWVLDAIQWYRAKNSDFGDALLCAYARHHHCEVSTFDKDLIKKFTEVAASAPLPRIKT